MLQREGKHSTVRLVDRAAESIAAIQVKAVTTQKVVAILPEHLRTKIFLPPPVTNVNMI